MLNSKLFEVRGEATFIPLLATKLDPGKTVSAEAEARLLKSSGFAPGRGPQFLYCQLSSLRVSYDSAGSAFLGTAIRYIEANWDTLTSGQVIDVDYILGTRPAPRSSDLRG